MPVKYFFSRVTGVKPVNLLKINFLHNSFSINLQGNLIDWFLYDASFFKKNTKINVFKIPQHLYFIKNTEYSSFLLEVDLRLLRKFWRKNAKWQFINKYIKEWSLIFSSARAFSSLLSTSSHHSNAKVLKVSWLFQECICRSTVQITRYFSCV